MFAVPSGTRTCLYCDNGTRDKKFEKHWLAVIVDKISG